MKHRSSLALAVVVLVAGLVLAGCPTPPPMICPEPGDGDYEGTWVSTEYPNVDGTVLASLTFEGSTVSGTVTLTDLLFGDETGPVTGTVNCDKVTLDLLGGDLVVTGTVATTMLGWTISGQYEAFASSTVTTLPTLHDVGQFTISGPV